MMKNAQEIYYPDNQLSADFQNTLSIIVSVCAFILIFTDSRVLLRTFVQVSGFAELAGVFLALIFIGLGLKAGRGYSNKYGIYLAIYLIMSMLRYVYAGVNWRILIQSLPNAAAVIVIASFGFHETFIRHMMTALAAAMSLHFIGRYIPISFVQEALDVNTAYGFSSYLSNRYPGFTAAPGVLSLYATIGTAIGLVMLSKEKTLKWGILTVASVGCGIATENRSYVVGFAAVILLLIPIYIKNRKGAIVAFLIVIIASFISSYFFLNSPYGERMGLRFAAEILERDVATRLTEDHGFFPALKALRVNPFLGTLTQDLRVYNGEDFVSPSNGYVSIFTGRGVFFGGIFICWTILACCRLWKVVLKSPDSSMKLIASALFAAFLAGQVVCIFDALLESGPMLMLLTLGLISNSASMRSISEQR